MRTRILLGTVAAALALGTVAPAQAAPKIMCARGFEAVCLVISLPCILVPKYFDCPA